MILLPRRWRARGRRHGEPSREQRMIAGLRDLATHPAARGLHDDVAVIADPPANLVLTHDMLVEGVHFLSTDPPGDVAWKLVAVNLSDLAAKGATPVGALMGYGMGRGAGWDRAFTAGLGEALAHFALPLLGGDTVGLPSCAPRTIGLTVLGSADHAPPRSGARSGDGLWITGPVGDAGLGLRIALGRRHGPDALLAAYRRPYPRLAEGRALAPVVHAMCDVSDGVLIDARRMAEASGLAVTIDIARLPLSDALVEAAGDGRAARLDAACAGDDYQLLCAAGPHAALPPLDGLVRIGTFADGHGLSLHDRGEPLTLPDRLGYEHGAR